MDDPNYRQTITIHSPYSFSRRFINLGLRINCRILQKFRCHTLLYSASVSLRRAGGSNTVFYSPCNSVPLLEKNGSTDDDCFFYTACPSFYTGTGLFFGRSAKMAYAWPSDLPAIRNIKVFLHNISCQLAGDTKTRNR